MGRSCGALVLILILVLLAIAGSCRAATLESIHWSSSNAKFTPGQGLVLYPQIGDKMDIVCPQTDVSSGGTDEFYKVYLVSRSQMESCTIDKMDTPLLNCDKPYQDVKFTFKFQEFSPNLWGLEFLKGRDYYITYSSDAPSTLQESPTRFPPTPPKSKAKDASTKEEKIKSVGSDAGQSVGSGPGLYVWVISGCVSLLLVITVLLAVLWRYHQRRCIPDRQQQSASVSLSTLAVPKRDSISSDNNGSDRSDVIFPIRASDSMICRHYERVSSDYGPPVYIVQEIMPQSPTNIYYKV
ncbi:ephrin-B2a-like isoform X2 [Cololabis saira]|uniref:ephrin-B2a-like isoform X2 n=1 Tax=Cololabis saira TaxID=129043 RepID=UPI002AD4D28B|nr:ephrin-B2a-like isoform X2 [Cololabis saira]